MNMKFKVDTKFVFSGSFTVEAESAAQAKEFVQNNCGLVIGGNIHSNLPVARVDWEFDTHPDKITGRVRRVSE